MADINGNAVNKVEKLTMEEIADIPCVSFCSLF